MVHLFGGLAIAWDEMPLPVIPGAVARSLFAYLVTHRDRPHTRDLLADASRAGVLFAPGSQFLHDGSASRCMRLTVAQADESQIRRGVEALGKVVLERLHADPTARQAASVHV